MSTRSRRVTFSLVIAIGGAALCLALDHYWWSRHPVERGLAGGGERFGSATGDLLFVAIPFYVLAVITLTTRIRLVASAVGGGAIALLTVYEYHWANTTDSSTAGLAFVGAIQVGIPLAIGAWGLDRLSVRVMRGDARPVKRHP